MEKTIGEGRNGFPGSGNQAIWRKPQILAKLGQTA